MSMTLDQQDQTAAAQTHPAGQRLRSRHNAWPLVVLLAGYPLWWLLGLSDLLPLALAVPMLIQLLRNGPIRMPRGTGWWLLFLLWAIVSTVVLWADAPGAVPGGGPERLLVFGYRLAWYGACTIAFLWVGNARQEDVSTRRVTRLLGWMFLVTVAGGLLGMLAPKFEMTSLVEAMLPRSLSSNAFIQSVVHPSAATLTTFLGRVEYRPIAPFDYANSWGSNLSMYLPFFLLTWFGKAAGWRRPLGPVILAVAAIPVVYSMNRGMWVSLGAGAAVLLVYLIVKRRARALAVVILAAGLAAALFAGSPLATVSSETLDSAHSDDRRGQLLMETVTSTLEGSPILGFGSTRDVQGSFASIAGGSTPDCPACAVPPLGTQGHLWLVIFSQGFAGMCFFLLFFISRFRAHWRSRTPLELAGTVILLFFAIQMFIYDTLGMPLYTIMLTLGLVWREQGFTTGSNNDSRTLADLRGVGRRYLPVLLIGTLAGTAAGTAIAAARPATHIASVTLLLAPSPVYLSYDGTEDPKSGRITIDTEAALVLSRSTIDPVAASVGLQDPEALRTGIGITAEPNTQVLTLSYAGTSADQAAQVVTALAESYLSVRNDGLMQRRDQVLLALQDRLTRLESTTDSAVTPITAKSQIRFAYVSDVSGKLRAAIDNLSLEATTAGEVIRPARPQPVRGQPEVDIASSALLGLLTAAGLAIAVTFVRSHTSTVRRRRWLPGPRLGTGDLVPGQSAVFRREGEQSSKP